MCNLNLFIITYHYIKHIKPVGIYNVFDKIKLTKIVICLMVYPYIVIVENVLLNLIRLIQKYIRKSI
jgi:hypothetical protein